MINARDVALKVLKRVDEERAFAAAALAKELTGLDDPRESGLAFELVHGVLRRRSWLDHLLSQVSDKGLKKIDPDVMRAMRIGVYQIAFLTRIPNAAAVSDTVRMVKRSRAPRLQGLANALLRKIAKLPPSALDPPADHNAPPRRLATRMGQPVWLYEKLIDAFGAEGALAIAAQYNSPARRTLRVNTHRTRMTDIENAPGVIVPAPRLSPFSLDVTDVRKIPPLIDDGLAAYQDEAAQLAILALRPAPDERLLDACAGRGGKTAAMAMFTRNEADITAVDRAGSKLERLCFELEKQRLTAKTLTQDLTRGPGALSGERFDRILLDAPCSGSGTLGRRPEIRWRLTPSDVESLAGIQSKLLDTVAPLVKPGGTLLFVTCSIFPEEGRDHLKSFLETHPGFVPVSTPPADWPEAVPWQEGVILIDPAKTRTDGYQMLALRRRPE